MNHLIQKLAIMIFKQVKQLHKDKTDQLDILDIAKKFIGENSRRKAFFGSY